MKKILSLLLFALLAVTICTTSVKADSATSGSCGLNATWSVQNGVLTISGSGPMTDFENYNSAPWYDLRGNINSMVVEEGITSVGSFSARNSNISSVSLPSTLTTISHDAFSNCRLEAIDIPGSVTSIGSNAFWYCDNMSTVVLHEGLKVIEGGAFQICESLQNIVIPDSVTTIGSAAFNRCTSLATVTIGKNVSKIDGNPFSRTNLSKITVKTANKSYHIVDNALYDINNKNLICVPAAISGKFEIKSGVEQICPCAFMGCKNITSVSIPASVRKIEDMAFFECTSLKSLTVASNVTYIGYQAMGYYDVLIDDTLTPTLLADFSISGYDKSEAQKYAKENGIAFKIKKADKKGDLISSGDDVYKITKEKSTVEFVKTNSKKTSISIPDIITVNGVSYKVTSIGKAALKNNKKVTTLTIGTNVENIASEAFLNCSKLKKITIKTQKLKDKKIGAKAFKGLDKKATIKVPKSKLSAYTKLIKEAGFSEKTQKITK